MTFKFLLAPEVVLVAIISAGWLSREQAYERAQRAGRTFFQ